ncbi:trehalose-phosphatase [Paraurantiacibacter namhicola]|uniref:Trehalose 6-phosphate phosphatase n=1 Tax=Paraurantiacibacter namhicola TaxID=645517 RepID=A0A1C7D9Q6_9SPHN|nr:trehalose-phosphatase [Paraurantiacibacter namhicola]ANU08226.1 Trehalose-6-phosphate phosphatase [Paraurantiacibacter namhicola]
MEDLPPPPSLAHLQGQGPVALFLDFDGTLVELAPTPDAITPPDDIARRIRALSDRLDGRVAVVTGRALDDLQKHTGPLSVARAGSHGSHCLSADDSILGDAPRELDSDVVSRLETFAAKEGFRFERKSHGAALHYRSDPSLEDKGLSFAQELASDAGLDLKRGKAVIELMHPGADKGSAVRAFMQTDIFAGATPVFVGDDVTDEDGFGAASDLGGFGVLVGEMRETAASHRLDGVTQVLDWLDL